MKRMIALLAAALVMLGAFALAEEEVLLEVVNCEEWVSLRAEADTHAERLAKVPLGERVALVSDPGGDFLECVWSGKQGFILREYLFAVSEETAEGEAFSRPGVDTPAAVMLSGEEVFRSGEVTVKALRDYTGGERLRVVCFRDAAPVWGYTLLAVNPTELDCTSVFMSGTAERPRVMVYNAETGLTMLDLDTGAELWSLPSEEVHLGAGLTTLTDEGGTMYIAGYYGPDPVAVGAEGGVLWRSNVEDENIYWPYKMALHADGLFVEYGTGPVPGDTGAGGHYCVTYDLGTGAVVKVEIAMWE